MATLPLRRALRAAGHRTWGWGQGFNMGVRKNKFEGFINRVDHLANATGEKLVLIGWSLGGLYAREAAKLRPETLEAVITLGSPFSHDVRDTNTWRRYGGGKDYHADRSSAGIAPEQKPSMRTVAIWSSEDGLVPPARASGSLNESDEQIEVKCPHNDMVTNPEALKALLAALSG
jgi:pimeloyl-ACP methyl ester carboxylesterase